MGKTRRLTLFSYAAHDYKAAEVWLNRQAEAGWALEGFHRFPLAFAALVPTARRDLRYCIELTTPKELDDQAYLDLCRDAGWEECEVTPNSLWRVFRSLPGRNPIPLQTDPTIELERFFRKRFVKDLLALVIALPLLALYFWLLSTVSDRPSSWEGTLFRFLSSGYGLVILLTIITGVPLLLWHMLSELRYWFRCRRLVREGLSFPIPSQRSTRRRVWFDSLFHIIYLVYFIFLILNLFQFSKVYQPDRWEPLRQKPLVMAQDLGVSGGDLPCTLKETATPFYRSFEFEDHNGGSMRSEIYLAAGEPLARLAVSWAMEHLYYYHFLPADIGFDESYLADFGGSGTFRVLLLRQGRTTAVLSGNYDWTDPDILSVLWERLQLKE